MKTVILTFQANIPPLPLKTVNIRVLTRISLYFFSQCGKSFLFTIFSVRYLKKIGHVTLLLYALKYNSEVQWGPNSVLFCRWGSVRADLTKLLPRCEFRSAARVVPSGHGWPYSGDQGLVIIVGLTVVFLVLPTLTDNTGNQRCAQPSTQLWPRLEPTVGPTLANCFR